MLKKTLVAAALLTLAAQPALAAKGAGEFFVGAGLGYNDVTGFDEALGWQVFGGVGVGEIAPKLNLDVEVGYMDSGDFEKEQCTPFGCVTGEGSAEGLWATGVLRYAINPQVDLLGRAGYDFGDDDGIMVGVGVGFNMSREVQLRGEYVERDDISSLQFNAIYRLK